MSYVETVGRLDLKRVQVFAESVVMYNARSVPMKARAGWPGYSWIVRTTSPDGRPVVTFVQVRPKSVVRNAYGSKFPERCPSNVTYAVPNDAPDGTTRLTNVNGGTPVMLFDTSVQVAPPSRDTCTAPSSAPTHSTRGLIGDSPMVVNSL